MPWRSLLVVAFIWHGGIERWVGIGSSSAAQHQWPSQSNWLTQQTAPPGKIVEPSPAEVRKWLNGEAAYRRLRESIGSAGILWKQTPLREVLEGLAQTSGIAFLLDRRVDPGQLVDIQVENCSLLEAFAAIARHRDLAVCLVGPVVYVGPPAVAQRLNTLIAMAEQHVQDFPLEIQARFFEEKSLAWADLSTPQEILTDLATSAGFQLAEMQRLPHDLWARASLPPLSLVRRLCLVLQQFDLTFQLQPNGREIALVPLPERIALVRSYPAGGKPEERLRQIAQLAPATELRLSGGKIWVRGRLEDHYRIALVMEPLRHSPDLFLELQELLERSSKPDPKVAKPSFSTVPKVPIDQIRIESLQIRNKPLQEVLEVLSQRLGLEFRIPTETLQQAGVSLDQHISLEVQQASVDELLKKIFQPLGLRFSRRQRVVEVRP
ncbi:MAG: STN domain-containing protein [Thermoguttaceae bacterium]|nr:STN domain-containing protein [Thermoguttaceae bacterium]MDW8038658.1 hypothetical protein [Thermoguttaceae bacterium]